ncbi:MAG: SPOR domain-containing protein [Bacteroidota bacterium]|nr:SPOR domain-containing protein [Bacteroidota bacterium]
MLESMEEDTSTVETPVVQNQEPKSDNKTVQSNQLFSVQSDTLDIQPKRKQKKTAPSSISVKSSPPKKFYTVDVGAFRLQSNVRRHQEQLAIRFKLPVIVFVDTTIHLTRVCVGNFSSKKSATDFLTMMKTKYPKDYPDPWVSQLTK